MKIFSTTLLCLLLLSLFLPALPASAQVEECFGLLPAAAEAILDEPVEESWSQNSDYGYCVYASVAKSSTRAGANLLPTYGPVGQHRYVAATVWPVGSATDPFMYLAFAILDRDHGKFGDFLAEQGMTALDKLAQAEISVETLSRQFLPDLGDGALWYWQETDTGEHLTGIYSLHQDQRVSVQALVAAERTQEAVLDAMRLVVEDLIAANTRPGAPAPVVVDSCPHFTQFDAAAILQEPVNGDEPIGNLFFGPLPAWAAEEGMEEVLRGLCGYVSLPADQAPLAGAELPASDQTHLATQIDANHAVVASHLTAEISHSTSGTFSTDWFDLILLVQVLAAADPERADASFDALYAAYENGDFTDLLPLLYENAQADPSFTATEMPLAADDPRDEMLWLWQTLDDGYFSLLISRQGADFDLVAARLGKDVTGKTVLGYSQVVLGKIVDANAGGALAAGCDRLPLEMVEAIVGEPVQGQPVTNAQGEGCKYTPVEDDLTIDSADFSSQFQTFGLLAGLVPPRAAQEMLFGMVEELADDGTVTDGEALGAVLAAIDAEDFASALSGMAALEWNSNRWTVEALTEEGAETLFLYGKSGNGWPQFFLLQNSAGGGLDYLTGVLSLEIDEVRPAIVAAASQLAEPLPADETDASTPVSTILGCSWLTPEQATAILGMAVRGKAVLGERGDGCKYVPASEIASITPDDFSPGFDSYGLLTGAMPLDAAQWFLGEINRDMEMSESAHGDLAAAIEEGDIATALAVVGSQKSTIAEWQIETLTTDGGDVVWLSVEVEDGTFLSFFMLAQSNVEVGGGGTGAPGMWIIAVQLPAEGDVAAMQDAALAALAELS